MASKKKKGSSKKGSSSKKAPKPDTSHRGDRADNPATDERAEQEKAIASGKPWRGDRD